MVSITDIANNNKDQKQQEERIAHQASIEYQRYLELRSLSRIMQTMGFGPVVLPSDYHNSF